MLCALRIRPMLLYRVNSSIRQKSGIVATANHFVKDSPFQNAMASVGNTLGTARGLAFGALLLSSTAATAWVAMHMHIEGLMVPETDKEVLRWEWDAESDKWPIVAEGGTEKSLGMAARHCIRSAWMTMNWEIGEGRAADDSTALGVANAVIEEKLESTLRFLTSAAQLVLPKVQAGEVSPEVIIQLVEQRAATLELVGSTPALALSREEYKKLWDTRKGDDVFAARLALKLGDLSSKLKDSTQAVEWWTRSLRILQPEEDAAPVSKASGSLWSWFSTPTSVVAHDEAVPAISSVVPASPLGQRTLASVFLSLSTHLATSGNLSKAAAVESSALELLHSLHPLSSSTSASHALHSLFLMHRGCVLSIHNAEVMFASKSPIQLSIERLATATASSERVAMALCGLPLTPSNTIMSQLPPPPSADASVSNAFTVSPSMKKPALKLLVAARRSAAEAWNLLGVLTEKSEPSTPEKALACYRRSLAWSNVNPEEVKEDGLDLYLKDVWRNYSRLSSSQLEKAPPSVSST